MRALLILVVIVILGVGIYFGIQRFIPQQTESVSNPVVTITGVLNKVPPTSEYSYLLQTKTNSVGINSMKVDLGDYVGKEVSVTGQYSGDVLYADSVVTQK